MDPIDRAVAAWGDRKELAAAGKAIGIGLTLETAAALDELLARANGKRRACTLSRKDLLVTARDALADPRGIATRHGGGEFQNRTTLCLAVRDGKDVVIGVGQCWADRATPGRVWSDVGPWQQDFAKNVVKTTAWARAKTSDRVRISAKKTSAPAKSGSLLDDVLANPDDDGPRLVYADWLTSQGDPRGELIAVQCALAKARGPAKAKLTKQVKAILRRHRRTFEKEVAQIGREWTFERGFVASLKATAPAFASRGARLLAQEPVEELVISNPSAAGLRLLAGAEHVGRLRRLGFSFFLTRPGDVGAVRDFLAAPPIQRLRELELTLIVERIDPGELFAGVALPALESLALALVGADVASLAKAKLPRLRTLKLHGKIPPAVKKAFAKALS